MSIEKLAPERDLRCYVEMHERSVGYHEPEVVHKGASPNQLGQVGRATLQRDFPYKGKDGEQSPHRQMTEQAEKLEAYKEAVDFMARVGSPSVFPNMDRQHASFVMGALIRHAENRISIYEDKLDGDLCKLNPEIVQYLIDKIVDNVRVDFVIRDSTKQGSDIEILLEKLSVRENLTVCVASPEFQTAIEHEFGEHNRFAVVDGKGFRLETNIHERAAICSFNKPQRAQSLQQLFDRALSTCTTHFQQ